MKAYSKNSIYCFDAETSQFRRNVIWFVDSKYFEYFILFVIFLNSIALTLYDYKDRASITAWNHALDAINALFTAFYTLEAVLKIIAFGFVQNKRAYLKDVWNCIDFLVVIAG